MIRTIIDEIEKNEWCLIGMSVVVGHHTRKVIINRLSTTSAPWTHSASTRPMLTEGFVGKRQQGAKANLMTAYQNQKASRLASRHLPDASNIASGQGGN